MKNDIDHGMKWNGKSKINGLAQDAVVEEMLTIVIVESIEQQDKRAVGSSECNIY